MPHFIKTGYWDCLSTAPKNYLNIDQVITSFIACCGGGGGGGGLITCAGPAYTAKRDCAFNVVGCNTANAFGLNNTVCQIMSDILGGQMNIISEGALGVTAGSSNSVCFNALGEATLPASSCDLTGYYTPGSTISGAYISYASCSGIYQKFFYNVPITGSSYSGGYTTICVDPSNLPAAPYTYTFIKTAPVTGSSCSSTYSTYGPNLIVGGILNTVSSYYGGGFSTIVNGIGNSSSGYGSILNGQYNTAGYRGTILGGTCNYAESAAVVAGGFMNCAIGSSFVGTTYKASACGNSFIGTGSDYSIACNGSVILSSALSCTDFGSFIGVGQANCIISSGSSAIVSGTCNLICSINTSVIGGGICNRVAGFGFYSGIFAGGENQVSTGYSAILGGSCNSVSSCFSSVLGGCANVANCEYSFIAGCGITSSMACAFHTNRLVLTNLPTSAAGLPAGAVWVDAGAGNVLKIV